jgi:GH25 family lysozyme M1 (1,4-beta-N-acetylmuramidase)
MVVIHAAWVWLGLTAAVPEDAAMGDGLRGMQALTTEPRTAAAPDRVCSDAETTPGIDVSKWQGAIDWESVADSGIAFAFVRVSDGLTHRDPRFAENWAGAQEAGLMVGAYQFFRPDQDPKAQADLLVAEMGTLGATHLPPVIDVEDDGGLSPAQIEDAIEVWIDRVQSKTGVTPIIYTGAYFWRDNVASDAFPDHPLWVAHYTEDCPYVPAPWSRWQFHQYTDSGHVDGIDENVDRNHFNGSLDELTGMLGEPGVCGDGQCGLGEDEFSCRQDCEPCGSIPARDFWVIDESDACFDRFGDSQFWTTEHDGYGDDALTTKTTQYEAYNYGVWNLDFDRYGEYTVEVHVPAGLATSTMARYTVHHASRDSEIVVDQSRESGWVELGMFEFTSSRSRQWVRLEDHTGEDGEVIVFDAIRLTPADVYDPYPNHGRDDPEGQGGDIARPGAEAGCRTGAAGPSSLWMLALLAFARRRRSML